MRVASVACVSVACVRVACVSVACDEGGGESGWAGSACVCVRASVRSVGRSLTVCGASVVGSCARATEFSVYGLWCGRANGGGTRAGGSLREFTVARWVVFACACGGGVELTTDFYNRPVGCRGGRRTYNCNGGCREVGLKTKPSSEHRDRGGK